MRFKTGPVSDSRKNTSTRPASVFFKKYTLIIVLFLIILAARAELTAIVILLGLGLAAAGISQLWSHLALKKLYCERRLNESRCFPGESLELKFRLVNRKLLPLPWVEVSDEVPAGFLADDLVSDGPRPSFTSDGLRPGFALITRNISILGYSAASWTCHLTCAHRGYFPLGPLTITSGDIFGFYPRQTTVTDTDCITVYPRLFNLTAPVIPSLYPLGEMKIDQPIFEDPSRTVGIRDYVPGDSLRRIHWKASLRHGGLQVKVFEPSTTLRAVIFLAVDSFQQDDRWALDELELAISAVASLTNHLVAAKSQVGLFANTCLADTGQPARIQPGAGQDHLLLILDALAKTVNLSSRPFVEFFHEERNILARGTTLIFFMANVPPAISHLLLDLKERGYKITVFLTGESRLEETVSEIPCFRFLPSPDHTGLNLQTL